MAKEGLKPLIICYKDIEADKFKEFKKVYGNFESEESRKLLESSLCLVAAFGFADELRDGVREII